MFPDHLGRLLAARSGGICEMWIDGVCTTRADTVWDRTHTIPRRVSQLLHVCTACSLEASKFPATCSLSGWSLDADANPATATARRRSYVQLLFDDGTVETVGVTE